MHTDVSINQPPTRLIPETWEWFGQINISGLCHPSLQQYLRRNRYLLIVLQLLIWTPILSLYENWWLSYLNISKPMKSFVFKPRSKYRISHNNINGVQLGSTHSVVVTVVENGPEVKSWTWICAFHIALIILGKVWN